MTFINTKLRGFINAESWWQVLAQNKKNWKDRKIFLYTAMIRTSKQTCEQAIFI